MPTPLRFPAMVAAFSAAPDRPAPGPRRSARRATLAPVIPLPAPPPVIDFLSPDSGSTAGVTPVTIHGHGFQDGATVFVDGIAIEAAVRDSRTIHACMPPHGAGEVDVVVANPDALSAWETGAYTYVLP
jgi:hypothetical protein